ncbi:outer membrane protein TolC [Sphingomonas sp. JUb134]|nr:outer membrane protein TolC [Sphingomonas sp. JUb134]
MRWNRRRNARDAPADGNGGYVYGGYRVSRGAFPVYEDENHTNRLGEVKVGALYSLLRDRLVDERRTRRTLASGDIDIARFEREAVATGVQRRVIDAYQTWVAADLRLRAYRDLLESVGEPTRRSGASGATRGPTRNPSGRKRPKSCARVVRAEGKFQAAANTLSLYLRNEAGEPVRVGPERLPRDADALSGVAAVPRPDFARGRPDLQALLARIDQDTARLALAQNELRPRLDLRGEVGKDVGHEGLGGPSRTPLEAAIGVRFSVPLKTAPRGVASRRRVQRWTRWRRAVGSCAIRSRWKWTASPSVSTRPNGWPRLPNRNSSLQNGWWPPNAAGSSWVQATFSS